MSRQLSDEEVKGMILGKLRNRGRWGARYMPLDPLVRWLKKSVRKNGKRVQRAMKKLVDDGFVLLHKRGETVSLNPERSREILEFTRTRSPIYRNFMGR